MLWQLLSLLIAKVQRCNVRYFAFTLLKRALLFYSIAIDIESSEVSICSSSLFVLWDMGLYFFGSTLVLQGIAPTISVDNTSGVQLYLSKNSLEASITTAESTEINVSVPAKEGLDYDWVCLSFLVYQTYKSMFNAIFSTLISKRKRQFPSILIFSLLKCQAILPYT